MVFLSFFFRERESGRTDQPTSCKSTVWILLRHICFSRNAHQTLRGSQVPSARHGDASHVSESSASRHLIHNMRSALSNGALVAFGDVMFLLTEDLQLGVLQGPQLQLSLARRLFGGTRLRLYIGLDSSDTWGNAYIHIELVNPDLKFLIECIFFFSIVTFVQSK